MDMWEEVRIDNISKEVRLRRTPGMGKYLQTDHQIVV